MKSTELISKFNLSGKIDYSDLSNRIKEYLSSDEEGKVETLFNLIDTVSELDWNLFQYRELLRQKSYSELYQSLISTYALNPKLGRVPTELTQLDIKLRSEYNSDNISKIINLTFIPILLDLIKKFTLDFQLLKLLNVIIIIRDLCFKYHKKVKLTLESNQFNKIKNKYKTEINYFGFTKMFTESDLMSKYREFAKKLHPDMGGNAVEFIKMKEYYETLMNLFK